MEWDAQTGQSVLDTLIPPTERGQLDWISEHNYKTGEVIIVNESLQVAKKDFTSTNEYSESNWETLHQTRLCAFQCFSYLG